MHTHRIRFEERPEAPGSVYFRGACHCGHTVRGKGVIDDWWRDDNGINTRYDHQRKENQRIAFGAHFSDGIAR